MINNTSPFYISLVDVQSSNQGYIVNAGDVNSFILSTYKAKYDEIKGKKVIEEKDYYARVGESPNISKTFKFGSSWDATFYTSINCDIYLTIPKIPAGFDSMPSESEGLKKDWWLKPSVGNINFLNQFKIVKNTDEGFEAEKAKNIDSIYTDDTDWSKGLPNKTQFLADSKYSGKIYIKLGTIQPNQNPRDSLNYFFRSNVVSPTRYIRYGSLNLRNLRLYVDVFGLLSTSVNTAIDPGVNNTDNWKVLKFFHQRKYDNFKLPTIFDFKDSDMTNGAMVADIEYALETVIPKWYYEYLRGRSSDRNIGTFLEQPLVGRILILYKNKLGDQLKIIKAKEDLTAINSLVNQSNQITSNHSQVLGKISQITAMTDKEAINRIFGWPEATLTKAKELIKFVNF